jgi:hypothetical protein
VNRSKNDDSTLVRQSSARGVLQRKKQPATQRREQLEQRSSVNTLAATSSELHSHLDLLLSLPILLPMRRRFLLRALPLPLPPLRLFAPIKTSRLLPPLLRLLSKLAYPRTAQSLQHLQRLPGLLDSCRRVARKQLEQQRFDVGKRLEEEGEGAGDGQDVRGR